MMEIGMMVKGSVWVLLGLACYRGERWGEERWAGERQREYIHTHFLRKGKKPRQGQQ